jgi:hypothetical protein
MRNLIIGIVLGSSLTAGATWAFHAPFHNPGLEQMERQYQQMEREQQQLERFNQQNERMEQEQFRNENRMRRYLNPC